MALKCYSVTMSGKAQVRVNIYLDDPGLKRDIKMAAADQGVSLSTYCVEAIRDRLKRSRSDVAAQQLRKHQGSAAELDRLRTEIGPIGISVRELIDEGRKK